jgi:hypothetical protein
MQGKLARKEFSREGGKPIRNTEGIHHSLLPPAHYPAITDS